MAADLAAILEEREVLRGRDLQADIRLRLDALQGAMEADRATVGRIRRQASIFRRRLRINVAADGDAGALLAAAFPDRIAQRREPGSFRFSGGGGAKLTRGDALANAPLLVAAGLDPKGSALIRLAAPLDLTSFPAHLLARTTETVESGFDAATGSVLSRRRIRFGHLVLSDRTLEADPAEAAASLAAAAVRTDGALGWSDAARQLQARALWLHGLDPEIPDLSDDALKAAVSEWLEPHVLGLRRLQEVTNLDLCALLRSRLGWETAARIDRELPTHLFLPVAERRSITVNLCRWRVRRLSISTGWIRLRCWRMGESRSG